MHDEHFHHHHDAEQSDAKKTKALLTFMLEHNKEHARELHTLAHRLTHENQSDAAALIEEGIQYFDQGNDKLEAALGKIQEEE